MKLESMAKAQLLDYIACCHRLAIADRRLKEELQYTLAEYESVISANSEVQFISGKVSELETKFEEERDTLNETIAELEKEKQDLERDAGSQESTIRGLEAELEEMKSFDIREMSLAELAFHFTNTVGEAQELETKLIDLGIKL